MESVQDFLEKIGWKHDQNSKIAFTFNSADKLRDTPFFRKTIMRTVQKFVSRGSKFDNVLLLIIREAIRNASDHGNDCNPEKKIEVGLWAGRKGFVASVKDEGSFYKNPEVKSRVEKKKSFEQEWKPRHDANFHLGMEIIYNADDLWVDIENGILYILWMNK
jgi:anti-sigma regulatory factor (Ser/Thr protein kinase)